MNGIDRAPGYKRIIYDNILGFASRAAMKVCYLYPPFLFMPPFFAARNGWQ